MLVAHACNSSYWGGWVWGGGGGGWGGVRGGHVGYSTMAQSLKSKDHSPGWPGQKARPCLQNNQSKKGWRHGRVSAL
jgi:hypothetical protein